MDYRGFLIWTGFFFSGVAAAAGVWIAVTGAFRPSWWWLGIGCAAIGVAADVAEKAITRQRPKRALRRAHARTHPTRKDTHPV